MDRYRYRHQSTDGLYLAWQYFHGREIPGVLPPVEGESFASVITQGGFYPTRQGFASSVYEGDWLVLGPSGDLSPPISPELFAWLFEPHSSPESACPRATPSPSI